MRQEQGGFFRQTADQLKSSVGKLLGFGMETSPLLTMFAMASKRDIGELKYGEEEVMTEIGQATVGGTKFTREDLYKIMGEDSYFTKYNRGYFDDKSANPGNTLFQK